MLYVGQVPAVGYELEGAVWQPGDRLVRLGKREHPVALSPYHERGWLQVREPIQENFPLSPEAHLGAKDGKLCL
jgi:hypothetical protein